ncbi:MAG: hypothetical protein PHI11_07305 [Gallionella sp.]|nr:hypothetical protein [Gallionella sp.]
MKLNRLLLETMQTLDMALAKAVAKLQLSDDKSAERHLSDL